MRSKTNDDMRCEAELFRIQSSMSHSTGKGAKQPDGKGLHLEQFQSRSKKCVCQYPTILIIPHHLIRKLLPHYETDEAMLCQNASGVSSG